MGKELRTTAVQLKLHKCSKLDTTAWGLQNAQPFFPPLERLFKTQTLASLSEYGVRMSEGIESVVDATTIRTSKGKTVPVHRKTTMILSPFKWMRGDYGSFGLPKPEEIANSMQEKLQSPHTAGYVGAMASIALSESGCVHFPKVYGVYVALAETHTIDISDDYEDLSERRWFVDNLGKTFEVQLRNNHAAGPEFTHTRSQRPNVILGDDTVLDEIQDVGADHISNPSSRSHSMSQGTETTRMDDEQSDESCDDDFDILSCDCEDEDDEDEDDDEDDDDEPFAWATFRNTPVITTVMEQCEGTYYDLLHSHPEPEKHAAWVAQIVLALAYAQRTYGFVHNDLHGNNVMYVSTDQPYLYYKHSGVAYKVPTHGYILKIIDFDRATFSLRLVGMKEPRHFVSSQFQADEEAAGQYNVEPFLVATYPHIPPNSSFDLCRFATSIFWDMFPQGPDSEVAHPLLHVFLQWMQQPDGSSVLFRDKRDNHDRYHGFHLYKAIARYCKDATPRREVAKLTVYKVPNVPVGTPCLFIES